MTLKKLILSAAAVSASTLAFASVATAGSYTGTPVPGYTCPSTADCIGLGTTTATSYDGYAYFSPGRGFSPTGSYITTTYGDDPAGPTFDDIYVFSTFANGNASGSFSASFTDTTNTLSNVQVFINGTPETLSSSSAGYTLKVNGIPITAGAPDTFEIKGDVNGAGAGFDGTATFAAVSAAPEPSTWALMLGGLAFVGMALRRRASAVRFA